MSTWLPDTPKEVAGSVAALAMGLGTWWRTRKSGGLTAIWGGVISFLAAPVERALAQREAKALRVDNTRLNADNEAKDQEIARLRARLSPDSSNGSSVGVGGTDPTSR